MANDATFTATFNEVGGGQDGFSPIANVTQDVDGATITITDKTGTTTAKVYDGEDGQPGERGPQGQPGTNGVSPTITVTNITGGHRVTITDVTGTQYFDVMDGEGSGGSGHDGYSPTVTITDITGGHTITITDVNGDHSFNVMDGEDGQPGADGYSPTVTITNITNGHTITITDASGSHSFNVMDGQQGERGPQGLPGTNGTNGTDGVSPTITTAEITGGHEVTFTDADGTHIINVMDGTDGTDGTKTVATGGFMYYNDATLGDIYLVITPESLSAGDFAYAPAVRTQTKQLSGLFFAQIVGTVNAQGQTLPYTTTYIDLTGPAGADGYSPTVTITDITGGHTVTITDASGSHSFNVMDGESSSATIEDGSITTAKLADRAVTGDKIAEGAITASKLGNKAVGSGQLGDSSVQTAKIFPQAVTTDKLANGAVTRAKLDSSLQSVIDGMHLGQVQSVSVVPKVRTTLKMEIAYHNDSNDMLYVATKNIGPYEMSPDELGVIVNGVTYNNTSVTLEYDTQETETITGSLRGSSSTNGISHVEYGKSAVTASFTDVDDYEFALSTTLPYGNLVYNDTAHTLTCDGQTISNVQSQHPGILYVKCTYDIETTSEEIQFDGYDSEYNEVQVKVPYTPHVMPGSIGTTELAAGAGTVTLLSDIALQTNGSVQLGSDAFYNYSYIMVFLDYDDNTGSKASSYCCIAPTGMLDQKKIIGSRFVYPHSNGGTIDGFGWFNFELSISNNTITCSKSQITYVDPNSNPWSISSENVTLNISRVIGIK